MRRATLAVLCVAVLSAACQAGKPTREPTTDKASAVRTGGFGTYFYDISGTKAHFAIPAPADHPLVVKVEAYRRKVSAPPASYVLVELDNSAGQDEREVFRLSIVTDTGETVEMATVRDLIGDWQDLVSEGGDTAIYNEGVDLYNEFLNTTRALPGARATGLMAASETLSSVKNVFLYFGLEPAVQLERRG